MRRTALLALCAIAVSYDAGADSMRCGKWVLSETSSVAELLEKCGAPLDKTSTTEDVLAINAAGVAVQDRNDDARAMVLSTQRAVVADGRDDCGRRYQDDRKSRVNGRSLPLTYRHRIASTARSGACILRVTGRTAQTSASITLRGHDFIDEQRAAG